MSRPAALPSTGAPSTGAPSTGAQPSICKVKLDSLRPADSPRLSGESSEHIQRLAESEVSLPPILVHRQSMRVIDGMHRLNAAILRGQDTIDVQFFDGDETAAFVLGVEANIAHGLPLSLADRKAAAARILALHPDWSDRAIAASTGLSGKTVATLRSQASAENPQSNTNVRIGRDGRARPVNGVEGRRRASAAIAARPDAAVRDIARSAGVSPATAHDVRARMHRDTAANGSTLPSPRPVPGPGAPARRAGRPASPRAALRDLAHDPGLRYAARGQDVLRWLHPRVVAGGDWADLVDAVPEHCAPLVARLARGCAAAWQQLADELERRGQHLN